MEEKKSKWMQISIVVLVIALVATVGYIIYDRLGKTDATIVENKSQDEVHPEAKQEDVDGEGKTLYEMIAKAKNNSYNYLFSNVILYNKDVTNEEKLIIAYLSLDNKFSTSNTGIYVGDGNSINDYKCVSNIDLSTSSTNCQKKDIAIKDFNDAYSKFWGNTDYNKETFSILNSKCFFTDDGLTVIQISNDSGIINRELISYDKAEKNGDNLEIYVNYINDENGVLYKYSKYNKINESIGVATINDSACQDLIDGLVNTPSETDVAGIMNKCSQHGCYKLAFKKNNNGDYYWYSSEPVK
jgi:hypothetical protein